jgi:hypothetical protein
MPAFRRFTDDHADKIDSMIKGPRLLAAALRAWVSVHEIVSGGVGFVS